MRPIEYVFIPDENVVAEVMYLGAHFITARYEKGGIEYEVQLTNDEFEFINYDEE